MEINPQVECDHAGAKAIAYQKPHTTSCSERI